MRLVRLLPRLSALATAALALASIGPPSAAAQSSITTIAGTGVEGFNGDGSPATSFQLNFPFGVALNTSGTVCIADRNNHRVRCVTGGAIATVAGTGVPGYNGDGIAATTARLNGPTGVAFDSAGNLFIADAGNHIVRKITATTGLISTVAGIPQKLGPAVNGGLATASTLFDPRSVAIGPSGDIYISDRMNQQVRRVSATTGIISAVAGIAGQTGAPQRVLYPSAGDAVEVATAARLNSPQGIAVDAFGSVYIADEGNNRIRQVFSQSCDGPPCQVLIRTIAGNGEVCPTFDPEIHEEIPLCGSGGPATQASLNAPTGVAVDADGIVYIANVNNHRVQQVACVFDFESEVCTNRLFTVAGTGAAGFSGDGGSAASAQLNSPVAVAVSADGTLLYIADLINQRVREVQFFFSEVE
jgi:sugar lactone lactonase YvrE